MTTEFDVLLVESVLHASDGAAQQLVDAGHTVHRCYPEQGAACFGLVDPDRCPIVEGVDVALLVRPHVFPRVTALEAGVTCAFRAGVPIVEQGPEALDPFAPYLTDRSTGDVVGACATAVAKANEPLAAAILDRIAPCVVASGIDIAAITCSVEADRRGLHVVLEGPRLDRDREQAVTVRVMDAVRESARTYRELNVSYRPVADR